MKDVETIAVYSRKSGDYADLGLTETQRRAIERFLSDLTPGDLILDLGCGPGLQAEAMMAAGYRVAAVDATPVFVAEARARGVNAREAVFEDLTETAIYNGVWASFSLLHAPRDAFDGHLERIYRALKPGGRFFLGMKLGTGEGRDGLGRHYTYFTEPEFRDRLSEAGFTVEDVEIGREAGLAGTVDPFILIYAHA